MRGKVFYDLSTGQATDFDNENLELRFCVASNHADDVDTGDYAIIDGVLCFCCEFQLFGDSLSFSVCPAAVAATVRRTIEPVEPSPVATYETVCDVFNRLARLEREGHHGGQTFYVAETVWGLLTSMGVVIDLWDVETMLHYHGSMIDGSFNELNVQALAMWLETVAQRLGGEV